jgi:hypothetical protein
VILDLAFWPEFRNPPDPEADRADVLEQLRRWVDAEPNIVGYRVIEAHPRTERPSSWWVLNVELEMLVAEALTLGLAG